MTKSKGFYCKQRKGLDEFEPILKRWLSVMDEYHADTGGDHFYWYNERANISALAGAAWRSKCSAICEFQHNKKRGDETYLGRCDLFIQSKERDFYAEAKREWVSLKPKCSWTERFMGIRDFALKDALSTQNDDPYTVLGVSFIALYMPKSRAHLVNEQIDSLINFLGKRPYDGAAWYFPKDQRVCHDGEKNILPGTVMIIDSLKQSKE